MGSSSENILKSKGEAKKDLAKEIGFSEKKALIGVILDGQLAKGDEEILKEILEGAAALEVQVAVLADGSAGKIAADTESVWNIKYTRSNREKLLSAADMTVSFDFNDVEEMLIHGAVPISHERAEVQDYNPNHETGNAFLYKKKNKWNVFAAMVRACETYKFPYDWKNIVRQGLERG